MKSNRKYILLGILVLAFLIMCVVPVCGLSESSTNCPIFGLANSGSTEVTATHDTQWMYYREVTIKESSGTTLTNYQVLVELNPSNFPDKAKSDGSDLRFVEDGEELCYWIEDYDAGAKTAKIWVNVSSIPANGEAKIKMYSGNPSAASESSGDATFIFYDEIPNGDKWYFLGDPLGKVDYSVGNPAPSIKGNGDGRHSSGALSKQKFDYSNGLWLEADIKTESDLRCGIFALPTTDDYWNWIDGGVLRSVQVYLRAGETTKRGFYVRDVGGYAEDWYDTNWHKYAIAILPKGTVVFYVDGTHKWTSTGTINPSYNNHGILIIGHDPEYWFDNVKVRKYTTPEPTIIISQELSTQKDSSLTPTPTPPEKGLVGYWNFNEGSGNMAYDSSGSGNDGTIHGATWVDNGSCKKALCFDGVDDYVETNPATFQSNDITVEAWIYPKSFSSYKNILHKGDRRGANNFLFSFDLISNKINFDISSNGNTFNSVIGTTNLELNKWYHVVGVYRSRDKFFAVYVNGTEDNTKTATLSSLYHDASKYWIGARYDNRQFLSDRYFNGIIDEVRIYDRALSEEEIRADMNECAPTLATIQVPIDSTGSRTTPTINVNGVDYAVVGVMYVDSPDSPPDAAGSDLPQGITVDLEELGLDYVETVYLATQNAWSFDMPNDIKVATLVCEYADGGPPTTLDLIMGVNTAEWAWENPTQAAAFGAQPPHSMPPVITSTPTTGDSDQEYIAHTYAASVNLDPTRTLSNLRLELVDVNQLLAYRSPSYGVPTWIAQACMAVTLEGRAAGFEGSNFEKESPIEKCRPMEETIVIGVNDMEIFFKIKGEVDGNCEIYEKVVKDNTGYGFEGKDMTCKIPMGAITGDSPLSDNIKDYCNGPLADAIRELTMDVENK